ncbi:hypothetical protein FDB50_10335 [Clostridium botulinum]|uniref:Helix-turn-helix domain-containing protein n=1 Tax=Clostridium botulinum TaxID=1491 RepID=A0A846JU52_CLOBO|nr:hypothetical protein [Clostridium botulinum]NFN35288.1 hypothetical protein [Clostridium botulinum]
MVENVGYMVSPLGLTERQILIYQKLYEKCNFTDMTVKYTIEQLKTDIKIVDININAIYRDIKLMIKKEYLEVIAQGRKGNPSIYKIAKIDDLTRKLNESYMKTKRKLKPSNNEGVSGKCESYMKTKQKLSENPIKEKEKDNIYSVNDIENIWNLYPNKKGKSIAIKKIPKLLNKYGKEQIERCIVRYSKEAEGKEKQYILNGSTFFNGRYEDYLDNNFIEEMKSKELDNLEDYIKT